MAGRYREEVLNVELARLLSKRSVVSAPETIHSGGGTRRLPDVVVSFRGLRVVIEGKTADVASARAIVAEQARHRVDEGLAQIALAVVYPAHLRTESFTELPDAMTHAQLDIQVHTEAGNGPWIPVDGVDPLLGVLLRTYEQLVNEDVVAEAVEVMEAGIDDFVREVRSMPAGMERMATLLEVRERGKRDEDDDAE